MRALVRTALFTAVAAVATTMAPMIPAQAAQDPWTVEQSPSVQIDEMFFMHEHLAGHRGNWHELHLWVQQDDDGVGGNVADYRCAPGADPTGGTCTLLAGYEFGMANDVTVTWHPRLKRLHVKGKIVMDDYVNDGPIQNARINLRLTAAGKFSRTVTRSGPTGTDPLEYKRVDIQRGGRITAHGHLAWLKAAPTKVTNTQPLHVYWVLTRGPGPERR